MTLVFRQGKLNQERRLVTAGLDATGFRASMASRDAEEDAELGGAAVSDEERYRDADRFNFPCAACGRNIIFDNAFTGAVST